MKKLTKSEVVREISTTIDTTLKQIVDLAKSRDLTFVREWWNQKSPSAKEEMFTKYSDFDDYRNNSIEFYAGCDFYSKQSRLNGSVLDIVRYSQNQHFATSKEIANFKEWWEIAHSKWLNGEPTTGIKVNKLSSADRASIKKEATKMEITDLLLAANEKILKIAEDNNVIIANANWNHRSHSRNMVFTGQKFFNDNSLESKAEDLQSFGFIAITKLCDRLIAIDN